MDDNIFVDLPEDDSETRFPAYEKFPYTPIFFNPDGDTAPGFADDYYAAAQAIVKRIVEGRTIGDIECIPALFLCRHCLELALKDVLFHSRWLKTKSTNVARDEPIDWPFNHNLSALWNHIKKEFPAKMGRELWDRFDTDFVEQCVAEFHKIDPIGERFRYRTEKKGVSRDPLNPLAVSWPSLLRAIEHGYNVLDAMDTYLVETYGENKEWEAEMNSW